MARHEGGVTAYAETLKSYHQQLSRMEGRQTHPQGLSAYNLGIYHSVLLDLIEGLRVATDSFNQWQEEKGYLRRRPVQRFFIHRLAASTLAKTAKALEDYRDAEAHSKDFPRG